MVLPFVGSTAPIAAFMATKGGGRTGLAPGASRPPKPAGRRRKRRAKAKRRMAGAGYFASRCKGGLARRRKITGPPPLPGRAVCRKGRPLKKAVDAVLSDQVGEHYDRIGHEIRHRRGNHPSAP